MKFIRHARLQARICRNQIGVSSENLLARIEKYLWDKYKIELIAVHYSAIEDGRAELRPAENCLLYDERLNATPDEKLFVIAHELGHLELHGRLTRRGSAPDPVYGSMYWNAGTSALTRYNSRSQEEAEANAFAAEFLCPCEEVFAQWRSDPQIDSRTLAEGLSAPVRVVRMQLAEAVYQMTFGNEDQAARKEFACDDSQEAAARSVGRPVLVDAGPGTGKTATLVRRIEYLLSELRAEPENMLVLTFSNDAAAELEERVALKFGSSVAARIRISTFHGFGLAFLQHHGQLQELDASVCVLDEAGQAELVTEILGTTDCAKILKLSRPDETVREIVRHIGYLKDRLCGPGDLAREIDEWRTGPDEIGLRESALVFLEVFWAYEKACAGRQRVDFPDLISKPIEILAQQPELKEKYREKYKWVLVDEYQDVSRATAILLQHLCGGANSPWVVGDKRQSIFRFRGAAPENVDEFVRDFRDAVKYSLGINYRSCAEIVTAANEMAHLMETPNGTARTGNYWQVAESNPNSIGAQPVSIAIADSDQAEYEGIADQVQAWLRANIPPHDIVVLARRNIDVRDIALALGRRDIRAIASGLVTAEGAAGDLAAVVTLIDRPMASLPRLAFALGRGQFDTSTINAVIKSLRPQFEETGSLNNMAVAEKHPLAAEIHRAVDSLQEERFSGDAFTVICAFLFDGSDYLRRLLNEPESAERMLAFNEIVASLNRAAVYRFSHLGVRPHVSRKGFGKHFRESLAASVPYLMPARSNTDAVRVMSCHSSKGLEFPCVVVAGQTLSRAPKGYKWLPPALRPRNEDDVEQADSLLFVGATRAQQALMISYATTSSGLSGARQRETPSLLRRWQENSTLPVSALPPRPLTRIKAKSGTMWGGAPRQALAVRNLDHGQCSLNTYIRDYAGVRFPLNEKPLYPGFYVTVRLVMQLIVKKAHRDGKPVDPGEARAVLIEQWNEIQAADHPHHDIYFNLASAYVERFAEAFIPESGSVEYLSHVIDSNENFMVRLDLVAFYRVDGGAPVAITFRPESLQEKVREKGLLWGALGSKHRATFVLLKKYEPELQPVVFSGDDGKFHRYQWGTRKNDFENETERLLQRFKQFAQGVFIEQVEPFICDGCDSRIACPYWLNALESGHSI
jgi:DNA helicase-2/ATP-dependent DNA helicase PcrA